MEEQRGIREEIDRLRHWRHEHSTVHATLGIDLALLRARVKEVEDKCAQVPELGEEVRKLAAAAESLKESTDKQERSKRSRETLRLSKTQMIVGVIGIAIVLVDFIRSFI